MAGCTCENWSLQDLSSALQDMHKDNKRIVVPMFQRGKRWKKAQEQKFIDSLIKGYPVGTMLFYETYEDNKRTYIFTAMDQLSIDRFDVEHIAPKEQMRKLIEACDGDGLPISCIANLFSTV